MDGRIELLRVYSSSRENRLLPWCEKDAPTFPPILLTVVLYYFPSDRVPFLQQRFESESFPFDTLATDPTNNKTQEKKRAVVFKNPP